MGDVSGKVLKTKPQKEITVMAAGAAPAPERKIETKAETTETGTAQPVTLKQRIVNLLHDIFQGREDHLGWRQ